LRCELKHVKQSDFLDGRQAGTLSKLLKKRHPRTLWPLCSAILAHLSSLPLLETQQFRRYSGNTVEILYTPYRT